jgi:hypothetical protein
MARWDFPGSDPIDLDITVDSGDVTVMAGAINSTVVVAGSESDDAPPDLQVSFDNGQLTISQWKSLGWRRRHGVDLTVTVPAGSRCSAKTAGADLRCQGELGTLHARTASGEVTAEVLTGTVTVVTASGDVRLGEARSSAAVNTASGDITLERADGDVQCQTASGDIDVGTAAGSVSVKTASGDARISRLGSGKVKLVSVSGDLEVGVAAGTGVYLDLSALSGQISSELEPSDESGGAELTVSCHTVSGNVLIRRASPVG